MKTEEIKEQAKEIFDTLFEAGRCHVTLNTESQAKFTSACIEATGRIMNGQIIAHAMMDD